MFRVTWWCFGDEVWEGDFPTLDHARWACTQAKKLAYYEIGLEVVTFSIWYEGHLIEEITL